MTEEFIPQKYRTADLFTHIDMGFLNRRLAISALGPMRSYFLENQRAGTDHMTVLRNDHLLVEMLIDLADKMDAPTLAQAIKTDAPRTVFKSTERLAACPQIYDATRVTQRILFDIDLGKEISVEYHTAHIVSDTGRMTLASGFGQGYREAMVGILHQAVDRSWIEPIVMGASWLEHPRNGNDWDLAWYGNTYGEIVPEDIEEFSQMSDASVESADEWMSVMKNTPESHVKSAIASLLNEPTKNDWGGEENDHFSANVTINSNRKTAAFLLKGPSRFTEMTPAMCGKNGDQVYRLANSGADISVIQHAHLIGSAVRETIRAFTATPGRSRKFCIVDGQATFRLLKAYDMLPR